MKSKYILSTLLIACFGLIPLSAFADDGRYLEENSWKAKKMDTYGKKYENTRKNWLSMNSGESQEIAYWGRGWGYGYSSYPYYSSYYNYYPYSGYGYGSYGGCSYC